MAKNISQVTRTDFGCSTSTMGIGGEATLIDCNWSFHNTPIIWIYFTIIVAISDASFESSLPHSLEVYINCQGLSITNHVKMLYFCT